MMKIQLFLRKKNTYSGEMGEIIKTKTGLSIFLGILDDCLEDLEAVEGDEILEGDEVDGDEVVGDEVAMDDVDTEDGLEQDMEGGKFYIDLSISTFVYLMIAYPDPYQFDIA